MTPIEPVAAGQLVRLPNGRVSRVTGLRRRCRQDGADVAIGDGYTVFYPLRAIMPLNDDVSR